MKSNNKSGSFEPYEPAEIHTIAKRIEGLAGEFRPTVAQMYSVFPQLIRLGFSPVLPRHTKLFLAMMITERNSELLFTENHPHQKISALKAYEVLNRVAKQLPDSIIRKFFNVPGITWLETGDLMFISNRFTESELADRLIELEFESYSDYKQSTEDPEGFTVSSKMND